MNRAITMPFGVELSNNASHVDLSLTHSSVASIPTTLPAHIFQALRKTRQELHTAQAEVRMLKEMYGIDRDDTQLLAMASVRDLSANVNLSSDAFVARGQVFLQSQKENAALKNEVSVLRSYIEQREHTFSRAHQLAVRKHTVHVLNQWLRLVNMTGEDCSQNGCAAAAAEMPAHCVSDTLRRHYFSNWRGYTCASSAMENSGNARSGKEGAFSRGMTSLSSSRVHPSALSDLSMSQNPLLPVADTDPLVPIVEPNPRCSPPSIRKGSSRHATIVHHDCPKDPQSDSAPQPSDAERLVASVRSSSRHRACQEQRDVLETSGCTRVTIEERKYLASTREVLALKSQYHRSRCIERGLQHMSEMYHAAALQLFSNVAMWHGSVAPVETSLLQSTLLSMIDECKCAGVPHVADVMPVQQTASTHCDLASSTIADAQVEVQGVESYVARSKTMNHYLCTSLIMFDERGVRRRIEIEFLCVFIGMMSRRIHLTRAVMASPSRYGSPHNGVVSWGSLRTLPFEPHLRLTDQYEMYAHNSQRNGIQDKTRLYSGTESTEVGSGSMEERSHLILNRLASIPSGVETSLSPRMRCCCTGLAERYEVELTKLRDALQHVDEKRRQALLESSRSFKNGA